jgi:hypothetical protein
MGLRPSKRIRYKLLTRWSSKKEKKEEEEKTVTPWRDQILTATVARAAGRSSDKMLGNDCKGQLFRLNITNITTITTHHNGLSEAFHTSDGFQSADTDTAVAQFESKSDCIIIFTVHHPLDNTGTICFARGTRTCQWSQRWERKAIGRKEDRW